MSERRRSTPAARKASPARKATRAGATGPSRKVSPSRPSREPRRGLRVRATARIVIGTMLLVGVLFLAVFPTRTYLRQRDSIETTSEQLAVLRSQTERLRSEIARLRDPAEVERIARAEYNLAKPGEELFLVIPSEAETLRRASEPVLICP